MAPGQQTLGLADLLQRAIALHRQGQLDEAARLYRQILNVRSDHFDARHLLGVLRAQQGRHREALDLLAGALKARPGDADALHNRGNVLSALQRYDEALASYDAAVSAKPDFLDAIRNRGSTLLALDRCEEALAAYDSALALQPGLPEVLNNQGIALWKLGRFEEACACYERVLALQPDSAEAMAGRGNALTALGRHADALTSYQGALALQPDDPDTLANVANALAELGRNDEALARYDQCLAIEPERMDEWRKRGNCLCDLNRLHEALASYDRALAIDPGNATLKLARCMANLPVIYDDESQIEAQRCAYEKNLRALIAETDRGKAGDFADAVGRYQPFFLPYQDHNDRELQSIYGTLVCRAMAERYPAVPLAAPPAAGEPVRVGFVSGFFYEHSVWKILAAGWMSQLDKRRFELFGYHTGERHDGSTAAAAAMCKRFVAGPRPVSGWRDEIAADQPHVLIYPEIGMDAMSGALAALRLAPVQCMTFGHPNTCGYPTLDYFLSGELIEPGDGDAHYSERLIRLPNLGISYEPLETKAVPLTRAEIGLRDSAVVYWCCQSLFKYLPQHDEVFARIAREVGDCQFAFIEHPTLGAVTRLFRERLNRAFAAQGLNAADHCVILGRLSRDQFVAVAGISNVVLDSIGWSGGNTTYETLDHDVPVVTQAGEFMRGRVTAGILWMMGVGEMVAETVDDYVATAVRLGRDPAWRAAIRERVRMNKHRVFRDRACITTLEQFLERVARDPGAAKA